MSGFRESSGGFTGGGGSAGPDQVVSQTTTYTIAPSDDVILCDASGGAFTVTLPAASGNSGFRVAVKKTDSSANAVTIDGDGSDTIDGVSVKVLVAQYESAQLACDGTEWWVLSDEGTIIPGIVLNDSSQAVADANTTALQAAMDAGAVTLPIGTLWIDGQLDVTNSIFGFGPGLSIIKQHSALNFERVFSLVSQTGLILRDFKVDGNGNTAEAGEQCHNIFISKCNEILVENVHTHDAQGDGIAIHSDSSTPGNNITVRGCKSTNRGRAGISMIGIGSNNVTIESCDCDKGTQPTPTTVSQGAGIAIEPSVADGDLSQILLRNNIIEGVITSTHQVGALFIGLRILFNECEGIEVHQTQNFLIAGNTVGQYGILLQDHGTPTTGRGSIEYNYVDGTVSHGITMSASAGAAELLGNIVLRGNSIRNTTGTGISLAAPTTEIVIENNYISDAGTYAIGLLGPTDFIIRGNLLVDVGTVAIGVNSSSGETHGPGLIANNIIKNSVTTSRTGVELSAAGSGTADQIMVIGNNLAQVHTEAFAIRDTGTSTYCYGRDNIKSATKLPVDENFDAASLRTLTSADTVVETDSVLLCDATSAAFTVTLPSAVGNDEFSVTVKKIDSSANAVTVDGSGSQTIDDGLTAVMSTQYESVTIISDGAEWWIL